MRKTWAHPAAPDARLAAAGMDRSPLLHAEVNLADLSDVPAISAAWDAWLDPEAQPRLVTQSRPP